MNRRDPDQLPIEQYEDYLNSEIKIKCTLPNNDIFTCALSKYSDVNDVRYSVSKIFQKTVDKIIVCTTGGEELTDDVALTSVCEPGASLVCLIVRFTDQDELTSEKTFKKRIIVTYKKPNGKLKYINVDIFKPLRRNPWLGGYKHKVTNKCFLHAASQTGPVGPTGEFLPDIEPKFVTRDTQTRFPLATISVNTPLDKALQTCALVQNNSDLIVKPRPYKSFDEIRDERHRSAITIQKWVRGWITRSWFKPLFDFFKEAKQIAEQGESRNAARQNLRTASPKTKAEIGQLYDNLKAWWELEYKKIKKIRNEPSKRAALYQLLEKEINYLFQIERKVTQRRHESIRNKQILKGLEIPPLRVPTGDMATVQELKDYKDVYLRAKMEPEERLQFLNNFKLVLDSYLSCRPTKDILKLIDQEMKMIQLGVSQECFFGLRNRVDELFKALIKKPEVNPKSTNTPEMIRCQFCRKWLASYHFPLRNKALSKRFCLSCDWMKHAPCKNINLEPYRAMLADVRQQEAALGGKSSICHVVQPLCIWFIVNLVWHGHSALSESCDLTVLRLPRWLAHKEWAPWNCILLTQPEADIHDNVTDLEEVYSPDFIGKVRKNHILTHMYFKAFKRSDTVRAEYHDYHFS